MSPWHRPAWVFDLDGTLTEAVHDFDAMRRVLGVPPGVPLIEGVAALAEADRDEAWRRIEAWEWAHAELARPGPGVVELLDALASENARIGVVTRNLHAVACRALEVAGLAARIRPEDVVGRHEAAPKPAPDGIAKLLRAWDAAPRQAVMVGDHLHDLAAGRAAGVLTVLLHADAPAAWAPHADLVLPHAHALLATRRRP